MSENSDVKNVSGIWGIAMTSVAIMRAEIGSIGRFSTSGKLHSYGGKSPNIAGSGGKVHGTVSSKIRNPHLSNSAYECAVSLAHHRTPEFVSVCQMEIAKKKPTQVYIVVGKRLLSHVYSIMKNQKPYRERLPGGISG